MAPYGRLQTITFAGQLTDGSTTYEYSFSVLAGAEAPTVMGGWAKWAVVDRPQRVGVTQLQGYDPLTLDVPVLFDSVVYPPVDGFTVEQQIEILEWMGGRGRLYTGGHFSPGLGDSPLVTLITADAHGHQTELVPLSYQGASMPWLVIGIDYDQNPLRDEQGRRIRQAATVHLLQHVSGPNDTGNDSPSTRAHARQGQKGKFSSVTVRPGYRTYQEIATRFAHNPTAAREILKANENVKKLKSVRSVNATLPTGARVRVPLSVQR